MLFPKVSPDGHLPQQGVSAPSRVAAVGPYIQSSTMPRMPPRPDLLVKPALPDGPLAMQPAEGPMKVHTLPNMRSGAASQTKGKNKSFSSLHSLISPILTFVFPQVWVLKECLPIPCSYLRSKNLLVVFTSVMISFLILNNTVLFRKWNRIEYFFKSENYFEFPLVNKEILIWG